MKQSWKGLFVDRLFLSLLLLAVFYYVSVPGDDIPPEVKKLDII